MGRLQENKIKSIGPLRCCPVFVYKPAAQHQPGRHHGDPIIIIKPFAHLLLLCVTCDCERLHRSFFFTCFSSFALENQQWSLVLVGVVMPATFVISSGSAVWPNNSFICGALGDDDDDPATIVVRLCAVWESPGYCPTCLDRCTSTENRAINTILHIGMAHQGLEQEEVEVIVRLAGKVDIIRAVVHLPSNWQID